MEQIILEQARIVDYHAQTNVKSGDNFATVKITTPVTGDVAKTFKCYDSVFTGDGIPHSNLKQWPLKLQLSGLNISFAPIAGATLNFAAEKADGFAIYPTDDGLEMQFTVRVNQKLNAVHEFFNRHTISPHTFSMEEQQGTLIPKDAQIDGGIVGSVEPAHRPLISHQTKKSSSKKDSAPAKAPAKKASVKKKGK